MYNMNVVVVADTFIIFPSLRKFATAGYCTSYWKNGSSRKEIREASKGTSQWLPVPLIIDITRRA